ncbi:MAG: glycosyltransferase family 4 protein [Phycisphaerales bacterium]|nr:glycosyltransferase family 4 protein [Phycisphaerales bacterium]
MRVLVALEARFHRTLDGAIWSPEAFDYGFWRRYLGVFEQVAVVARVQDAAAAPTGSRRADGPGVSFIAVPYFVGPWEYAHRRLRVRRAIAEALRPGDAAVLRVPGQVGGVLEGLLRARRQPFGVEVVGDPYEVFAPGGGVRSPLRPWLRWWVPRVLRRQCATGCAVAYVTARTLPERYPAAAGAFVTTYSSIELDDEAYVTVPRPVRATGSFELVFVGSLEQLYKGPDVLIDAVAAVVRAGLDVRLTMVGDGRYRPQLEGQVRQHGITGRVRFAGRLPGGAAVRAVLDLADLFVLPSRTEGLPKVVLEAQARGLPCIASAVGGIPELLPEADLVPAGDVAALAARIRDVLGDAERRAQMALRNLEVARRYHRQVLDERRHAFQEAVWAATSSP